MVRTSPVQAAPKQARDPKRKTGRHLDDESGKIRRRVPGKAEAARTVSQRRKKTPSDADPDHAAERSIGVTITI
jgi:hypothetical protein